MKLKVGYGQDARTGKSGKYKKDEIMKNKAAIKKAGAGRRPAERYKLRYEAYRKPAPLSRSNLKENLGLLLYHLHSPLTQRQRRIGWQLFEVLLTQYASERPRAAKTE